MPIEGSMGGMGAGNVVPPLLEVVLEACGEDTFPLPVIVVEAAPALEAAEAAPETVVASGELTAEAVGDEVGLRQLSLLGVANMDSSGLPPRVPPGVGMEAGPPEDSTRSFGLQLWSCNFGEVEDTMSVRPLVDESGGEFLMSMPPIMPAPGPTPMALGGPPVGLKSIPAKLLALELLS